MKKILLSLLVVLFLSSIASAELYFLLDSKKEVISVYESIGDKKLEIVKSGDEEIVVLPGELADYDFSTSVTNYKYQNGKFIMNQAKIDADNAVEIETDEIAGEQLDVDNYLRDYAIAELEKEGKIFKFKEKMK